MSWIAEVAVVVIGIDAHKQTHTMVAVDRVRAPYSARRPSKRPPPVTARRCAGRTTTATSSPDHRPPMLLVRAGDQRPQAFSLRNPLRPQLPVGDRSSLPDQHDDDRGQHPLPVREHHVESHPQVLIIAPMPNVMSLRALAMTGSDAPNSRDHLECRHCESPLRVGSSRHVR